MKNKSLVSILMSTYNEPLEWLQLATESILNQTYKEIELIVVLDNPQRIDLLNYIQSISEKYTFVKYIINEENIGLANSLNKAFSLSSGEYVARMDADDIMLSNRIEKQVAFMEKNPNIGLLGTSISIIDMSGNIIDSNKSLSRKKCMSVIKYKSSVFHPTWLMRRSVFLKNSGYTNFPVAQDYDFLLRAYQNGVIFDNLSEKLLLYRMSNQNVSAKKAFLQAVTQTYIKDLRINRKNNSVFLDEELYLRYVASQERHRGRFDEYIQTYTLGKRLLRQGSLRGFLMLFYVFLRSFIIRNLIIKNIISSL